MADWRGVLLNLPKCMSAKDLGQLLNLDCLHTLAGWRIRCGFVKLFQRQDFLRILQQVREQLAILQFRDQKLWAHQRCMMNSVLQLSETIPCEQRLRVADP